MMAMRESGAIKKTIHYFLVGSVTKQYHAMYKVYI